MEKPKRSLVKQLKARIMDPQLNENFYKKVNGLNSESDTNFTDEKSKKRKTLTLEPRFLGSFSIV